MTLSMAWIRNVGTAHELVVATDSRLSGGASWDCCPKILLLPRGDCVIAFAGSTQDAYPLMLQFQQWVHIHPFARDRSWDIGDLKKRMRLIFNDMRLFITSLPRGQTKPDPPDCELIFGGWSWKALQFRMWRFYYDPSRDMMDFEPTNSGIKVGRDHPIVFAGSRAAVEVARDTIIKLLIARGRFELLPVRMTLG